MAKIILDASKLKHNYQYINTKFKENNIDWSVVSKLLCGNELFLKELLKLNPEEICDSRLSNLKLIKKLSPNIHTVYIKPPSPRIIPNLVKYADVSFNTEFTTIQLISNEASKQNKIHNIILMIEMGDLREGILGDSLIEFYKNVFQLPNIRVTGIGTNLNCLNGVMPSEDKLIHLILYKKLIEATFNVKIPWVTGGTSVVFPLFMQKRLPKGINHFRIGETLFFGNDLIHNNYFQSMKQGVFKLKAEILEINLKPKVPVGELEANPSGEYSEINENDYGKTSFRAIVDIGVLDIATTNFLKPIDKHIEIVGASSDMVVLDMGDTKGNYKVGDYIEFEVSYMGILRLMNSFYIEKEVINPI